MFVGARLEEVILSVYVNALTEGDMVCLFLSYPKRHLIIPRKGNYCSANTVQQDRQRISHSEVSYSLGS